MKYLLLLPLLLAFTGCDTVSLVEENYRLRVEINNLEKALGRCLSHEHR